MADRALLRAAAQQARITHPAASYSSDGALSCRVCRVAISSAGLFDPHLQTGLHKQKLAELKELSGKPSAAASLGGASSGGASSGFSSGAQGGGGGGGKGGGGGGGAGAGAPALPLGFFSDPRKDAEARGEDWRAKEKAAKEKELSAFLGWASEVAKEGEAEEAAEVERYAARSELAEAEATLGKVRVALLRDLVAEGRMVAGAKRQRPGEGEQEDAEEEEEEEGAGAVVEEMLGTSLLAVPNSAAAAGVSSAELSSILAAKRAAQAREVVEDDEEDLLDWRKKGSSRK